MLTEFTDFLKKKKETDSVEIAKYETIGNLQNFSYDTHIKLINDKNKSLRQILLFIW